MGVRVVSESNPSSTKVKKVNSRRYFYVILGFYLFTIVTRASSNAANASGQQQQHTPVIPDSISDLHLQAPHLHRIVRSSPEAKASPHVQVPPGAGAHDTQAQHGDGPASASESNTHSGNEDEHHAGSHEGGIHVTVVDFAHVSMPFIIAAWILCACFAKIGFHVTPKLEHLFPESCLLIILGVVIGFILYSTNSLTPPLTPTTFFLFMLPPIILDAGYFMPNRMFFNNLGTILLFAVVATMWNTFAIGLSLWGLGTSGVFGVELPLLQTLLFSSLISAVDPVAVLAVFEEIHVNEVLYIVVFGESLLNDAVTVVLYHIFEGFSAMGADKVTAGEVMKGIASFPVVALGGTAIGIIWGLIIGLTTRYTNHVRIIEPLFVFVMAYLSYLCAEVFHMSGILAITFCGITMKNYVEANISHKSHTTVKYTMKMLSSSAETIIFVFLGVATIHDSHYWSWWFVIATIVFCSVYRVIGVIIFTWIANKYRIHKLGFVDQFVMSYGGLRGAVAFALVLLIEPETVQGDENLRRMFVTTTITVVFFTVFAQGITIKPLVEWLKVARADSRKETISERINEKLMDHLMAGVETLLGQVGHNNIRARFKYFDQRFIRPYLIREVKGAEPKILETYARLILEDAMMDPESAAALKYKVDEKAAEANGHVKVMGPDGIAGAEGIGNISPEALASLIKNVLMDTMADADISTIVKRRKSSARIHFADPALRKDSSELVKQQAKSLTPASVDNLLSHPNMGRRLSYSRHSVNEMDLDNLRPPPSFKSAALAHIKRAQERRASQAYLNAAFNYEDEKLQQKTETETTPKRPGALSADPRRRGTEGNILSQKAFQTWLSKQEEDDEEEESATPKTPVTRHSSTPLPTTEENDEAEVSSIAASSSDSEEGGNDDKDAKKNEGVGFTKL